MQALAALLPGGYILWVFANHIFLVSESGFSTITARILLLGALLCLLATLPELAGLVSHKMRSEKGPFFPKHLPFLMPRARAFLYFLQSWLGFWESAWRQPHRPLAALVLGIAVFLQIRDCAIDYYRISGKSMEPGLRHGSIVFLAKWKNGFGYRGLSLLWESNGRRPVTEDCPQVKRKDLLVFEMPAHGGRRILLKRAIGLPGDSYRFLDGRIWINGSPLEEPYLPRNFYTSAEPPLSLLPAGELPKDYHKLSDIARYAARFGIGESGRVPKHTLLVLGDNRSQSIDSRNFGFVPYNRILGVVWP